MQRPTLSGVGFTKWSPFHLVQGKRKSVGQRVGRPSLRSATEPNNGCRVSSLLYYARIRDWATGRSVSGIISRAARRSVLLINTSDVRVRARLGLVLGLGIGLWLVLFKLDICTTVLILVRYIRCIDWLHPIADGIIILQGRFLLIWLRHLSAEHVRLRRIALLKPKLL